MSYISCKQWLQSQNSKSLLPHKDHQAFLHSTLLKVSKQKKLIKLIKAPQLYSITFRRGLGLAVEIPQVQANHRKVLKSFCFCSFCFIHLQTFGHKFSFCCLGRVANHISFFTRWSPIQPYKYFYEIFVLKSSIPNHGIFSRPFSKGQNLLNTA